MLKSEIIKIVGIKNLKINEPMSWHTTFKVGGIAKFLVTPNEIDDIINIINLCKSNDINYYILGNGSNVLVRDEGIDGVVIKIASNFSSIDISGTKVLARAGALLVTISNRALNNGLGGFEFASGIPGTLGGAIVMNAGAYGKEMKDVVLETKVLTDLGDVVTLKNEEHGFKYRDSLIQKKNYVVLESTLELYNDDKQKIKEYMDELMKKRVESQPLKYPNAGSTFKRPDGYFAAKLIQDAGLKGYTIGGAMVSTKHSGFIINRGDAKASDILRLMDYVKEEVYRKFGVILEPEVKII